VQEALSTVSQALTPLKANKTIMWLLDRGFDDVTVWRTIWQAHDHLVCRVYHQERLISFQDRQGQWQPGNVRQARGPDEQRAAHSFTMYRQRWGVEESFKFLKTCLGWEEVQVLDWQARLPQVALAWVAARFLYERGVGWDWAEIQLLAKLGGWEPHKDRKPGKITVPRGLSRLLDRLLTQAVLTSYEATHHGLPPQIAAFLGNWGPPREF
jgi:hypothetical protein